MSTKGHAHIEVELDEAHPLPDYWFVSLYSDLTDGNGLYLDGPFESEAAANKRAMEWEERLRQVLIVTKEDSR